MKFTSEDLMKAMGLQVGDRVRIDTFDNTDFEVCKINNEMCIEEIVLVDDNEEIFTLTLMFNYDYQILPRPKRVGDLKCNGFDDCSKCPLRTICEIIMFNGDDITFYEILEKYKKSGKRSFDQEIYNLLKNRLDKEVEK